jgi:hypothetical protein
MATDIWLETLTLIPDELPNKHDDYVLQPNPSSTPTCRILQWSSSSGRNSKSLGRGFKNWRKTVPPYDLISLPHFDMCVSTHVYETLSCLWGTDKQKLGVFRLSLQPFDILPVLIWMTGISNPISIASALRVTERNVPKIWQALGRTSSFGQIEFVALQRLFTISRSARRSQH